MIKQLFDLGYPVLVSVAMYYVFRLYVTHVTEEIQFLRAEIARLRALVEKHEISNPIQK